MLVTEPILSVWETFCGSSVYADWTTILPLWPCSIYLFVAPFAFFCKGAVRAAACGYICTLGLLGGAVNFVYPANYLSRYSCISFAGFRTIFYHGAMVFTAAAMLLSGDHSFRGATRGQQLLLPAVPALLFAIPSNIANELFPGSDYMFFRLDSFFFAPLGRMLPGWLCALIVALLYLAIHALPYLPSYIASRRAARA